MSQSLSQIYLHLIFSTKDRRPFLQDETFRAATHAYLAGTCKNLGCPAIQIGGVADHVHLLCRFGRRIEVSELIRELKRESSKWIKEEQTHLENFYWQNGYGAFSISPSHVETLVSYIANQEEHHRQITFQEEFRRICQKYHVEIDEQYVWD
ncbi:MAG TPA: IS200/IS605 family transposase [Planctomicrobium sp.]|nr:IS200/IS605 family transposase [Planctomicrobium sp.]